MSYDYFHFHYLVYLYAHKFKSTKHIYKNAGIKSILPGWFRGPTFLAELKSFSLNSVPGPIE